MGRWSWVSLGSGLYSWEDRAAITDMGRPEGWVILMMGFLFEGWWVALFIHLEKPYGTPSPAAFLGN